MSDLRVLLHEAAPAPAMRIDVHALIAEAERRRRRRRIGLWFASIAVALGVGGGAVGVLAPADRPSQVNTLPLPTEHIREPEKVSASARRATTTTSVASNARTYGSRSEAAPAGSATQYWASGEREASSGDAGCMVEGYSEGVRLGYGGGGYMQEHPECQYRATEPGGYTGRGHWVLEIRRGTEDIGYRGGESPDCMPVGTIQPGDVVTVWTTAGSEGRLDRSYINVGPEYGC